MDAAAQPATAAAPAPEQRLQTTAASSPAPELYREFSIGVALTTALDELVRALSDLSPRVGVRSRLQVGVAAVHQVVGGLISPAIALMILSQFDRVMNEALRNDVQVATTVKANLKTYRFIDNVWTFVLDDATFTLSLGKSSETIRCKSAKIVAAAAPPR